ncbi:hypothetical protein DSM112329_04228 [Paraconexibacter sp. AEG42_29]|uniref:Mce/MlaD domain-containing protein n=2 Tax=Paraconexibacter sp. AEG42_29 TaxID=2997339 RepID=A0AAU7B036_9ACTN
MRRRRASLGVPALVGGVIITLLLVVVLSSGGEGPRTVSVVLPDAHGLLKGQEVRAAGALVGDVRDVQSVDRGRKALVTLNIEDVAWPITDKTTMRLRWGGTVSFSNRYIEIHPGSADARPIADGGQMSAKNFAVPVEYDELLAMFDRPLRTDLRSMLDAGGPALDQASEPLGRALDVAPGPVQTVGTVLGDLASDTDDLETLLRSAARTTTAIDRSDPGIRSLLDGARGTFAAVASESNNLEKTLARSPATFTNVRDTLKRADPTLRAANDLVVRLDPGVGEIRRLARPLNRVLKTVVEVGPDARTTLATVRRASPDVNALLDKATALLPDVASVGKQLTEQLPCLRPYTPDIVSFFTNWGDFLSSTDGRDHFFRAYPQVLPYAATNTQSYTPETAAKIYPGIRFAFPRPPGNNAGQPWFQPECGITKDALDPAKDPEARQPATRASTTPGSKTEAP